MPETVLAAAALIAEFTASTAAALGISSSIVGGLLSIGVGVGLNFLTATLLRPKTSASATNSETVQQSIKQNIPPRVRHYGRVKCSGPWIFAEQFGGQFYKVVAFAHGEIDAIEQYWFDDKMVTLDGFGITRESPLTNKVAIRTTFGRVTESSFEDLKIAFPGIWTDQHRGNGVALLLSIQKAVAEKDFLNVYPNGVNTLYRVVIRGSKVTDLDNGAFGWSENPANIIYDYLSNNDGNRLPASVLTTPQALAGWQKAKARCNQTINTLAGVESRYVLWGSYALEERPADVLARMLNCCDGVIKPTGDGGYTLDIGDPSDISVTITSDMINAFDISRGRDVINTANTIRATYTDPTQNYQSTDADPWVDLDDISERGEISSSIDYPMCPSHSRVRRLMKLAAYRANPNWVITISCNLKALIAFGERFVIVNYDPFGINEVFEIQEFKFNITSGGVLQGVTITLASMPTTAYDWNASIEEGIAPASGVSQPDDIPTPSAPEVDITTGPIATVIFGPSPSPVLFVRVEYKKSTDTNYTIVDITDQTQASYITPTLTASINYDFVISYLTEKGRIGPRSLTTTVST